MARTLILIRALTVCIIGTFTKLGRKAMKDRELKIELEEDQEKAAPINETTSCTFRIVHKAMQSAQAAPGDLPRRPSSARRLSCALHLLVGL